MFESHLKPPISFPSVSGAVCSFDSQYAGLPLKSCVSQISGYQEGSGEPSPSNIRNLVSFNSATLTENGNTHTFTFGQTVYSANLDVLRGILSITHRYIVLNGSEDWISLNNNKAGYIELTDANIIDYYGQAKCSQYRTTSWTDVSTTDDGNFTLYQNSSWSKARLVFNFAGGTLEGFKTQLNNSNIQVVYKLAEPIEIPLGGIQLLTQEGQNNIWADTGDTTLQYIKLG